MQFRLAHGWQFRQESNVDTTVVRPLNQDCRKIAQIVEVFRAQPFENSSVFDFLHRNNVRAPTIIDLPDSGGEYTELVIKCRIAPVESQAFIAPALDFDAIAGVNVFVTLFGHERQVGLVVLARIVNIVEEVLHIERHDCHGVAFLRRDRNIEVHTQQQGVLVLTGHHDRASIVGKSDGLGIPEIAHANTDWFAVQSFEPGLAWSPQVIVDSPIGHDDGGTIVLGDIHANRLPVPVLRLQRELDILATGSWQTVNRAQPYGCHLLVIVAAQRQFIE